jgi:hypothetical protein
VKSLPFAPEAGKLFHLKLEFQKVFLLFFAALFWRTLVFYTRTNSVLENTGDENLFEVKKIRIKSLEAAN